MAKAMETRWVVPLMLHSGGDTQVAWCDEKELFAKIQTQLLKNVGQGCKDDMVVIVLSKGVGGETQDCQSVRASTKSSSVSTRSDSRPGGPKRELEKLKPTPCCGKLFRI